MNIKGTVQSRNSLTANVIPRGNDGVPDYSLVSNALKGKKEGNPVVVDEVSPFAHEVSLKLQGKNLFKYQEVSGPDLSVTKVDDGLVLNGVVEATNYVVVGSVSLDAGVYSLSLNNPVAMDSTQLVIVNNNWGFSLYLNEPYSKNDTLSIPQGEYEVRLHAGNGNAIFENFVLKPQLVKNGVASVTKYGKNLLDLSQVYLWSRCTYNAETGEVTSAIEDSYYCSMTTRQFNDMLLANKGKPFTFSVGKGQAEDRDTNIVIYGTRTDGAEYQGIDGLDQPFATITIDEEFTAIDRVALRFNRLPSKGTDTTTVLSDFQFEVGDTATEYEPYVEPVTYTADENGVVSDIVAQNDSMTFFADEYVTIKAEYNRDINKALAKLLV